MGDEFPDDFTLRLLSEVKKGLRIGKTKLFAEIKAGNLQTKRIGRRVYVTTGEYRRYVNSLPTAAQCSTSFVERNKRRRSTQKINDY